MKRLLELLMIRFVLLRGLFLFTLVSLPMGNHNAFQLHQFLEGDNRRRHVLFLFLLLFQLLLVVFVVLLQRFHHSFLRFLLAITKQLNCHINLAHVRLVGIFLLFLLLFGYASLPFTSPT